MRIILSGASGHMGRAVAEQAKAEGIEVLFGVDAAGGTAEFPIYVSFAEAPAVQDAVVIDFSRPDALEGLLSYAESNRLPGYWRRRATRRSRKRGWMKRRRGSLSFVPRT